MARIERAQRCRAQDFTPGQPRYTENNELNTWPGWGCEPKPGDVRPFFDLFNYLTAAITDEERKYLLQGLAYPIQHPGTKLQWALLIWSIKHGTGKSLLGEMLGKIYGENFTDINDAQLHGNFNQWAVNRQFIMGTEIIGGDSKRKVMPQLKHMITRSKVWLNSKMFRSTSFPTA